MVMSEEERWVFLACQQACRTLNPNLWIPDINKQLKKQKVVVSESLHLVYSQHNLPSCCIQVFCLLMDHLTQSMPHLMWSRAHLPQSLLNNSEGEVMFNFFWGSHVLVPKPLTLGDYINCKKYNDFGSLFGFATSSSGSQRMMLCNSLCTCLLCNNCCCSEVSQPRGTHFYISSCYLQGSSAGIGQESILKKHWQQSWSLLSLVT